MHVKTLQLRQFKSFANLRIALNATPRLVVLCGENGTGKSSIVDGIAYWRLQNGWGISDPAFFAPGGDPAAKRGEVEMSFHESTEGLDLRSLTYVRTAQRVTVEFDAAPAGPQRNLTERSGPTRSIDIDDRVQEDYLLLISASIEALWDRARKDVPVGEIVSELVGQIQEPLGRLLDLRFDGPDAPFDTGATLRFSRGPFAHYGYKNLSGGEKAVFDLLLDLVVKRHVYDRAVWCIDEPELHVNPRIQGPLLQELQGLLGENAQLWVATHSAGMLAEARRQYEADPGSVVFLDFNGLDRAAPISLAPTVPNRPFWQNQLRVSIGDMADLIAPEKVVLCEGSPEHRDRPKARWDARVMETVFKEEFSAAAFVSVGNADDVVGDRMDVGRAIEALVSGVETLRVIDRDARSPQEVTELKDSGHRVLTRRHLEAYLMDPEVLDALCEAVKKPELKTDLRAALDEALAESVARDNAVDDYKAASGHFVTSARQILQIAAGGNSPPLFLRDTLAPLLRPGMGPYEQLREDIFGPRAL